MPIIYCPNTKQFYLHTNHTSYVMELYSGCLAHTYWGARLEQLPVLDARFPTSFGSFSARDLAGNKIFSTDVLPQECPTFGSADLRFPALHVRHQTGDALLHLRYDSHRIFPGKPALSGLPATYGDDCETLEITLLDKLTGIAAVLLYTIFPEKDVLIRSIRVENRGSDACTVEKVSSFCLDFYDRNFELIHFPGAWARERHIERVPIHYGTTLLDSKRGASSHMENPAMILARPETTETAGEAYGFCLVYSGSFSAEVSVNAYDFPRVQMGIQPFDFSWPLAPGESLQAPEAIMVYSAQGLGEMSRRFHRLIRKNLCRGKFRDTSRPVLINNWEATYFKFNEEKILALATQAKKLGVDLMVLDDGWFGHRDTDNSSLGDWVVDRNKLPNGLSGLSEKVNALGMQFGLWFEPEMVSPDSNLYRAHPDWCIHVEGRPQTESRQQLVLDLSKKEVCDYIVDAVSAVLDSNAISYVKWDMNRSMAEFPRAGFAHQYMLGLYDVLERITGRFPHVLFESCSGGGGRFDAGMLYYMPQTWTSDDTEAVERLYIQEGTGMIYPISTMGAHISAVPNHQTGRVTTVEYRSNVAMMGRFGLELDLSKETEADLEEIKNKISFYKQYEQVIHQGDLYRLLSPYASRSAAYEIIGEDRKTVMVFFCNITGRPCYRHEFLRLQGLESGAQYKDVETGILYDGSMLMNAGIPINTRGDRKTSIYVFEKQ